MGEPDVVPVFVSLPETGSIKMAVAVYQAGLYADVPGCPVHTSLEPSSDAKSVEIVVGAGMTPGVPVAPVAP